MVPKWSQPNGWGSGWKKVFALLQHMGDETINSAWLMWVDADIFVTRMDYDIRQHLDQRFDVVMGLSSDGDELCHITFNTGMFFLQNTLKARRLLETAKHMRTERGYEDSKDMEQSFLIAAMLLLSRRGELTVKVVSHLNELQALPQYWSADSLAVHFGLGPDDAPWCQQASTASALLVDEDSWLQEAVFKKLGRLLW